MSASHRRRWPVWALVSAAWFVPAILAVFQVYVQGLLGNRPPATARAFAWAAGDWLVYALLTPLAYWMARKYPFARGAFAKNAGIQVVSAVVLCALWAGGGVLLWWALYGDPTGPQGMGIVGWFVAALPFGMAVYFAVVGVEHAVFYFVESRDRETQTARLSAQLAEARLGALQMQFQPHFLLNSLNAIAVVIRDQDTATATKMLDHLGEILRRVMRADGPREVSLEEELDFVRQYLAIEEIRFSDRLSPVFEMDSEVHQAVVPEFILQPLVENAIRHGLAKRTGATMLVVSARRDGEHLVLSVTDDGPGPQNQTSSRGGGVGLSNTRERLTTLYGDRARLELKPTPTGGAAATVWLPYRDLVTIDE